MAVRLTTKARRVSIGTEQIRRAAAQDPEVRRQLEREFRMTLGKEMAETVGDYFSEALNQAARITERGVPLASSKKVDAAEAKKPGSSVSLNSGRSFDVVTRFGNVRMPFWPALTETYRRRKAREQPGTERLFWRFTGKTYKFLRDLAIQPAVTRGQLRNVKATPAKSGTSKTTVLITSTINVPSTGDATIDGLVRNSFVRGAPAHVEVAGGKTLSPAGIVAVTESRRPLLSTLSAALGIMARKALGNLKQ